jgi:hypothetical protein
MGKLLLQFLDHLSVFLLLDILFSFLVVLIVDLANLLGLAGTQNA